MRVLGIDYGTARIGLALGDTDSRVASAWDVIMETDPLTVLARIHDIASRDMVEAIIVGVPRPLQDSSRVNAQMRAVRVFIEQLQGLGLPVHEQDETYSTQMAARQMEESHPVTRGHKRGAGALKKRDDLAAAAILQSWLDQHVLHP